MTEEEIRAFIAMVTWISVKACYAWIYVDKENGIVMNSPIGDYINEELNEAVKRWIITRDI